ncbi:LacI family DNA-binding transcriptional regulator (plasmid) [Shinella sp. PSBB067]|uniref:LacI family DNA-binding transcriptional regulator n=1 Tax=Shinella sp. PSBB067 TaxID=2715959 RepID=UPI00193C20F8|nr:LacI family DNA-binding transcriptional regulator [Shinella sp. PSBB067]QRI66638.1 LacI family DNA-binding transcriptional regulator [Shinella sp. PSBB067]
MAATITDVAKAAGVSKATVSKFLNGTHYVSQETKERIAAAVTELGYAPNRVAQGLSLKRSHTIGLVVANIGNPFYAELIRGAEEVAAARGYTLLLASTDGEPKRESTIVNAMRQRQVDGIAFASVRLADREVTALAKDGVNVVLASRHLPDAEVDMVLVDSVKGAKLAVNHLLQHGHRSIAYVGGPLSIAQFQERLKGWRDALAAAGIQPPATHELSLDRMDVEAGHQAGLRLLKLENPPTAIFAATDNLAFGIMQACDEMNCAIPGDLALVGFDAVPFGVVSRSPLTSVDGSGLTIGQRALQLLIDRIERDQRAPSENRQVRMVLQPTLCIRRSCGCRPGTEIENEDRR